MKKSPGKLQVSRPSGPVDDPPAAPAPARKAFNGEDLTQMTGRLQQTAALAHARISELHHKTGQIRGDLRILRERIQQMRTQVQSVCARARKWPF